MCVCVWGGGGGGGVYNNSVQQNFMTGFGYEYLYSLVVTSQIPSHCYMYMQYTTPMNLLVFVCVCGCVQEHVCMSPLLP